MRGNHALINGSSIIFGPIPAHAGKPIAGKKMYALKKAYPRACGETRRYAG